MGFLKNVSLKEALDLVVRNVRPHEAITLPLDMALGHTLAEDVYASQDIPPFDRSAMDGYALSSQDTAAATSDHPVRLLAVSDIHPSTAKPPQVQTGQAARIMTGGPVPPGADAVVRYEDVQANDGAIIIRTPVTCCSSVKKKGRDVQKGSLVAQAGLIVEPAHVGLLAALHVREVVVTRQPATAILAIGNELIGLHDSPNNPKIVASNLYMLSAMIKRQGAEVGFSRITKNHEDAIRHDLKEGLKQDMAITIGGTANGNSDLTRGVMGAMGVDIVFSGLGVRPGKGTTFGLHDGKPVFALPGTPSAAFTAFHTLVIPALWRLCGRRKTGIHTIEAILEKDIRKKPGTEHVVQGVVSQKASCAQVLPLDGPDVARLAALGRANGLIRIAPDNCRLAKGQPVSVQLLNHVEPCLFSNHPGHREQSKHTAPGPPVISIVGKSDAGKTTFLEKLVPHLTARGHKVGTIKHDVHGFDIDHKGKDSWRHKQAGAHTVTISSPKKVAIIKDVDREQTIDSLAVTYFQDVDLLVTEGYKKQNKPKIEVFRSSVHNAPLCTDDASLVAIVSDIPLNLGVPRFALNDIKGVADFVETRFLGR
jgi:molybdopterin molybdotransferase